MNFAYPTLRQIKTFTNDLTTSLQLRNMPQLQTTLVPPSYLELCSEGKQHNICVYPGQNLNYDIKRLSCDTVSTCLSYNITV